MGFVKEDNMNPLRLNDTEIHSLAELRQNADLAQITHVFLDGTLEEWLSSCYYEREANAVAHLGRVLSPAVERELCAILNIRQTERSCMTPEQQAVYDRKCAAIRRCSADEAFLVHALETATNQAELAELLDSGCRIIYLCEGSFSVPIRKSGIHYVGIGNPVMEAPFTEEQYRRAGITFEGILLPVEPNEEATFAAEQAAVGNGYDNFSEHYCRLASLLHDGIKGTCIFRSYYLDKHIQVAGEFYASKWEAKSAAYKVVETAYAVANSYFQPDHVNCIAPWLAEQYADIFRNGSKNIVSRLQTLSGEKDELTTRLAELVEHAKRDLLIRFEEELTGSDDYYEMYQKSYFLEEIEIKKNDYNVDPFDSDLLNGLARLIHDDSDYTIENLFETISELEHDLNKRADTFFGCAYREYKNFCSEAEKIAEEIGKDLSDDDLVKLGIQEEQTN